MSKMIELHNGDYINMRALPEGLIGYRCMLNVVTMFYMQSGCYEFNDLSKLAFLHPLEGFQYFVYKGKGQHPVWTPTLPTQAARNRRLAYEDVIEVGLGYRSWDMEFFHRMVDMRGLMISADSEKMSKEVGLVAHKEDGQLCLTSQGEQAALFSARIRAMHKEYVG